MVKKWKIHPSLRRTYQIKCKLSKAIMCNLLYIHLHGDKSRVVIWVFLLHYSHHEEKPFRVSRRKRFRRQQNGRQGLLRGGSSPSGEILIGMINNGLHSLQTAVPGTSALLRWMKVTADHLFKRKVNVRKIWQESLFRKEWSRLATTNKAVC